VLKIPLLRRSCLGGWPDIFEGLCDSPDGGTGDIICRRWDRYTAVGVGVEVVRYEAEQIVVKLSKPLK
jgi:hypothetical protein